MNFLAKFAVFAGQFVSFASKALRLGAGATWPGEVALRIDPFILRTLSSQAPHIILVAGTNGKTTTVKMIETILTNSGKKVRRNATGANLDNGLISALIADYRGNGKFRSEYFIFEVDEATLPNILRDITPEIVVLNNLFRDQLDRYGEVDAIAEKWMASLQDLPKETTVIVNSDDPHLSFIGSKLRAAVKYYGLEDPALFLPKMQHATDTIYCPNCGHRLTFAGVYFSHLGKWACGHCDFVPPKEDLTARDVTSPMEGTYNIYNTMAATLVAMTLGLSKTEVKENLVHFAPAFGRMETIVYNGRRIKILLSKNPTGFNESLRTIDASVDKGPVVFALNDRIPDGTDVSWIWDVDFEFYNDFPRYIVTGDRVHDMAVRLKYAGITREMIAIEPHMHDALMRALEVATKDEVVWVLATYSAMLDARHVLTGRKIL